MPWWEEVEEIVCVAILNTLIVRFTFQIMVLVIGFLFWFNLTICSPQWFLISCL